MIDTFLPTTAAKKLGLHNRADNPHVDQVFTVLTRMHGDLLFLIQIAVDERDYDLAERLSTLRYHFSEPIKHIIERDREAGA